MCTENKKLNDTFHMPTPRHLSEDYGESSVFTLCDRVSSCEVIFWQFCSNLQGMIKFEMPASIGL